MQKLKTRALSDAEAEKVSAGAYSSVEWRSPDDSCELFSKIDDFGQKCCLNCREGHYSPGPNKVCCQKRGSL